MTSDLAKKKTTKPRIRHRPEAAKAGWTPERRARQAALIRRWQPWQRSTGPKTKEGKARAAQNARRHGFRSSDYLLMAAEVRHALRLAAVSLACVRARFAIDMRSKSGTRKIALPPANWKMEIISPLWGEPAPDLFGGRTVVARVSAVALGEGGSARDGSGGGERSIRVHHSYRPVHSGLRLPRNAVIPSLKSALP
jgi:hypothetical protein